MKAIQHLTAFLLICYVITSNAQNACPDLAEMVKATNVNEHFLENTCSGVELSCFDRDRNVSLCGLRGLSDVIHKYPRRKQLLLCSCDALCHFHDDCCPDFSETCPKEAAIADGYSDLSVDKESMTAAAAVTPVVGRPGVECRRGVSTVVSCPRVAEVARMIRCVT